MSNILFILPIFSLLFTTLYLFKVISDNRKLDNEIIIKKKQLFIQQKKKAEEAKSILVEAEEAKSILAKAEEAKSILAKAEEAKSILAKAEEAKSILAEAEEAKSILAEAEADNSIWNWKSNTVSPIIAEGRVVMVTATPPTIDSNVEKDLKEAVSK